MRIIAGIRKGQKLITPKILAIRPSADATKEFIFNYLDIKVNQSKILDLFSGTGNLGIEALSRGASQVYFIERNRYAAQIIHKNLKLTQFESQSNVIISDVFKFLKWANKNNLKFDLIFADPPYQNDVVIALVNEIDHNNILLNSGLFIVEHRSNELLNNNYTNLSLQKTKKFGNTTVSFFTNFGG